MLQFTMELNDLFYFSTAHVYGAPLQGTFIESSPTHAVHPYATTHLEAESVVAAAHENRDIQGIRVRLSNGIGRPMTYEAADWRTLTSDLCRQAVVEKRMEMRTDGLQERNFITKTDIARAVQHLIALPTSLISDGLFNLGGSAITEFARYGNDHSRTGTEEILNRSPTSPTRANFGRYSTFELRHSQTVEYRIFAHRRHAR